MNVKVIPVASRRQRRDFFLLRDRLYQSDPVAVRPLDSMSRLQLDVAAHPFYQHAQRQMFVAYRDDRPVGRIVAIVDQLQQSYCKNKLGFFGFFETIDDQQTAGALIRSAEQWLVAAGCDRMRGPVDPSMKGEFGVLVAGHQHSPAIMTAYNHARYQRHLEAAGFAAVREFNCFNFLVPDAPHEHWQRLTAAGEKILKRYPQLKFKSVDKQSFADTMRQVNQLSNIVRSEGWGFVPLTEDELSFMIKNLRRVIRYDLIHVAYWNDQLVGYIVTIPDANQALKRTRGRWDWLRMLQLPWLLKRCQRGRVIALGVDPNFRSKGIAILLITELVKRYQAFQEWEFSWVDSENFKSIRAIARTLPLRTTRTYRLFEKSIVGQAKRSPDKRSKM